MAVEKIHDKGQTLGPPTGKLVGIVDTRADFDKASRELQAAGINKIEVLCGDEGISLLERINAFFFSDMEAFRPDDGHMADKVNKRIGHQFQ